MNTTWPDIHNQLSVTEYEALFAELSPRLSDWLNAHELPEALFATIAPIYLPLAAELNARINKQGCITLGISGGQGAGKSTLSTLLAEILLHGFRKKAVTFSIDDIYLSRDERARLATDVHPLLATRGVPGTHDPLLGLYLLQQLKTAGTGDFVHLPIFDKASDDRLPPDQWRVVEGPFDLIIFEGWCLGAMPQNDDQLHEPINNLERTEDPEGIWRRFVNDELSGAYIELFAAIDILLMLKVPSMEAVYRWRCKQEEKLRNLRRDDASAKRLMSPEAIGRFIQHYERISRYMLEEMPERADILFELDNNQSIAGITFPATGRL